MIRVGALALLCAIASAPGLLGTPHAVVAEDAAQPSKVSYIVETRADAVIEELASTSFGATTTDVVGTSPAALSDELVPVDDQGNLHLELHSASPITATEEGDVTALGGTIVGSTANLQWPANMTPPEGINVISAWIPAAQVDAAAALSWVAAITGAESTPPDAGQFLSEAFVLHNVAPALASGFDGSGVSIGVISDGVSNIAAAQTSTDLSGVNVLSAGSGDEGTAMLELIHDLAPGAALSFHTTGGGVANHVIAQVNLVGAAGAQIIAEDIPFDGEPAFQKGMAASIGDFFAVNGISVHSSAGNLGATHAARVPATGTGAGPDGINSGFSGCAINPTNVVDIDPGAGTAFDITLAAQNSFTLQWSEPRAIYPTAGLGGFTNLDLYVMNAAGTTCLASSTGVQGNGQGDTIEQISLNATAGTAAKLVVNVANAPAGVATPTIDLRWRNATAVDPATQAGSLNPDSNYTSGANAVAAANVSGSTDPTTVALENFSGGGPVQLITTTRCADGDAPPCAPVAGGPGQTVGAPAWTAGDGASVSGAGGFGSGNCPAVTQGDCRFFGTSAAAPHSAAIDALLRDSLGGTPTTAQINAILAGTSTDRGTSGFDNLWGAGVLNAGLAVNGASADLRVTKECKPDQPQLAGTPGTCTILVDNLGPSTADNVVLTDVHVGNAAFSIGTPTTTAGSCAVAAATVTCNLGNLGNGGRVTVTVPINSNVAGDVNDIATVTSDTLDPDASNNESRDGVSFIAVANVSITKSDTPDPVVAGTNLTYTLSVGNAGPSPAENVVVDDVLPAGVAIVSVAGTGGAQCNAGVPGNSALPTSCNFGTISAAGSRTMTIVVTVLPDTTGSLQNDAEVSSDTFDPDNGDNIASATTAVTAEADIVVLKTDSPDPVVAGKQLTYKVRVTNAGPSIARDVVMTDALSTDVTFVNVNVVSGSAACQLLPTNVVECEIDDLLPGAYALVYIDVLVKASVPQGTNLSNTASAVTSATDPNAGNNSATEQTLVNAVADLSVTKVADRDLFKPSTTVIYTITVTNNGSSDAQNVRVVDTLPPAKVGYWVFDNGYVYDTDGCALVGTDLACDFGTLKAGASISFNVYVRIVGSKGVVTNTATVTSTTTDPNTANNVAVRQNLIQGKNTGRR